MALIDTSETYQMTNPGDHIDGTDVYQSNRNLLDNPWFTVNQRGASGTISTANQFGADRWKKSGGSGSVIVGDGYFTPVGGGGYRQLNPWSKIISGRVYTVSAMTADGNVYSATGVLSRTRSGWQISSHLIPNSLWVGVQNNGGNLDILFTGQNGDIQVIAVKLELGSVSTLANDAPPDYGTELAKCKYYFRRITNIGRGRLFIGVGFSGGVEVPNIFGVDNEMRKTTSLAVTYSGSFVVNAGTDIAVTNITRNENNSNFGLSFTASGITPYTLYSILGSAGAYIDISADL